MTLTAVAHPNTLRIAAKAGVTDLKVDEFGRYSVGDVLLETDADVWTIFHWSVSPVTTATLTAALIVAQGIRQATEAMHTEVAHMTDAQLHEELWTGGLDYNRRQRVIAEQIGRKHRAEKAFAAEIENLSDQDLQAQVVILKGTDPLGFLWIAQRLQHFRAGRVTSWMS